jgi:type III pantothenate kinase
MLLVIDIGNSRGKWGLATSGSSGLLRTGSFDTTCDMGTVLGYQDLPLASLKNVLISCVSSDVCFRQAAAWLQANTPATVRRFISRPQEFGVINGYRNPEQLGADRWAALLAAQQIVKGRVLVVDCGTAATLDLLSAEGRHLGGYILPGLRMMRRALHCETAGLPEAKGEGVELAVDTRDGIAAGTLLAIVAAIESTVARHKNPPCLLTGGDAEMIGRYLQVPCQHEPDLVLKGLVIAGSEPADS